MKSIIPEITILPSSGLFAGRIPKAVFVRKHNLQVNLEAVEAETKIVTELTPKDWLFLVEGYKKYHTFENLFLDDFVK